jgi:membrane associated rhomboid family serine protease
VVPATSLLPIHDENPTRTFSYLTVALIAINAVLLFITPGLGLADSPALREFFCRLGVVPYELTGKAASPPVFCPPGLIPDKSVYASLVTSMFLHGGPIHLAGNMLFLWIFGNNIEDTLGRVRFLLFYLVTGVIAGYSHVLVNQASAIPTVGASGAVAGLLGAYIVLFPRARVTTLVIFYYITTIRLPAVAVLGIWFVSQFLIGAGQQLGGSGVAWMAHVGGFVAGAVLIWVFGGRRRARRAYESFS